MVRFKHRYLLVNLLFPQSLPLASDFPPSSSSHLPTSSATPAQTAHQPQPLPHLNESSIINLLRDSLAVNFGDVGAGEVGGTFSIKYLSPSTSTLIIRVSREHYRTLWAALTLLRRMGGQEVICRVIHISGTIRKTQHAAIAHDRSQILLSAKRQRLIRRRTAASSLFLPTVPTPALVEAAVAVATEEEKAEVEEKLRKSEEEIMGIEA